MTRLDLDSNLLDYIVKQGFQPGDRLPTISELQDDEHLGISSSKVREQLEVARALGIVEVRSKTGMKLREYSFTPAIRLSLFYALSIHPAWFEAFSDMRNHLEMAFWNEACERLAPEDKDLMERCIQDARSKLNLNNAHIQIPNDEHRTFHLTVFKRLENPFVIGVLETYWDAYEAVEINRYADYDYHTLVWDYHERILNAICAGDFERSKQLFLEHTRLRYHPNLTPTLTVVQP